MPQSPTVPGATPTYDLDRDPRVDHDHELYPAVAHVEDTSDVLIQARGEAPKQVVGSNVDDDGVAHFLRISADPDIPDLCGGCGKSWPCEKRVGVEVMELPRPDSGEQQLYDIAVKAAQAALANQRQP